MTHCADCRQQISKGPRCEICHRTYQRGLRNEAIAAGYISEERGLTGLGEDDIAALAFNGYHDLELLVKLRSASFDDRRLMTAQQIHTAPAELSELIHNVFLPRSQSAA